MDALVLDRLINSHPRKRISLYGAHLSLAQVKHLVHASCLSLNHCSFDDGGHGLVDKIVRQRAGLKLKLSGHNHGVSKDRLNRLCEHLSLEKFRRGRVRELCLRNGALSSDAIALLLKTKIDIFFRSLSRSTKYHLPCG